MATNQLSAVLARKASEKDLDRIAQSVGSNWEMLAPFLLKENAMAKVEQIKEDNRKSVSRIYQLLLTWSKQAAPDITLGHLFHKMLQVGTSVTVEWRTIAKYLRIEERDIRACKNGYQPPVQESSSNQHPDTDKTTPNKRKRGSLSLEAPPMTNPKTPGGGLRSVPISERQQLAMIMRMSDESTEGMQTVVQTVPVQATAEESMEVDSGRVIEKMEIDEQASADTVVTVEGPQTNEPCLSDRRCNISYRPPKDACLFDGRLIKLGQKDIDDLDKNYTEKIGEGAFGKVFTSSSPSEGFGMHVAVKKIPLGEGAHSRSIRREMITSRIMHPFILPLFSVVDRPNRKPEFWFVSPFCKKGDLQNAIKDDRQGNVVMKAMQRVKIVLHIALAIQYIHTEVPNVRDVIFHKDISSKNVVLDDACNARLIDFGLAREKDDETTDAKGRICYTHPDFGTGKSTTESWDYYSFAVIIRELLTGLEPKGCSNKFLKNMDADEVFQKLEKRVWMTPDNAWYLNDMAKQCLQPNEWTVSEFSANVVEKMKATTSAVVAEHATETSMTQEHTPNCQQRIEVCIACEKNSFLNPITCYCGTKLTTTIGTRCGALLVAGNDTDNKSLAKALTKDMEELKKLITSQAPRIIGISENNVRTVKPSDPGNTKTGKLEELWPQVKDQIKYFREGTDIETLIIYFSCHGAKEMGSGDALGNVFRLGSVSDSITWADFEKELESLDKIDKLIIFLDRCFPLMVRFGKRGRKFIQINACDVNQEADITDKGSIFTKYLIQGLKANSERKACPATCQTCKDYWTKRTDFITVSSLFDYVNKHMKKVSPARAFNLQEDSSNIAFYTDEEVFIEFEDCIGGTKKDVPLKYLQNLEQLKIKLLQEFRKGSESVKNVRIQRDTFRKENMLEDCETLEKVMSAWVHRRPLKVVFEPV